MPADTAPASPLAAVPTLIELLALDDRARLERLEAISDERILSALWAEAQREGHATLADLIRGRLKLLAQAAPDVAGLPVLLSGTDRMLEVELTDPEVNSYAQAALHLYQQADEDEEEEKERAKAEKERIKRTRAEANVARRKSLTRCEMRRVPCETRYVESSREVVILRLDTGAVVERREAKNEEIAAYEAGRQGRLF